MESNRQSRAHIGGEQGRGRCLACGQASGRGATCPARHTTPRPGGPRDQTDRQPRALEYNLGAGRPDGAW
jgi:hypothetical protein